MSNKIPKKQNVPNKKIPGTTILQGPQRKQGTRCAKVRSQASQAAAATLAASCQVRSSFSDSEAPDEVLKGKGMMKRRCGENMYIQY